MHSRKISAGLSLLLASGFLFLATQSGAQADSSPSGDEGTFNQWLEKKIDWRTSGFRFYWKDGFNYEAD
jgi:hypothetical protein